MSTFHDENGGHLGAAGNDAFLDQISASTQPMFDSGLESSWPDDMPQEEIFAAQMEYGPPQDDWLEDEANIMLLAREPSSLDDNIDPALALM
jgi:hypothetical protein